MGDVIVRQWGPNCYAAYIAGNGLYPDFVGTAETREQAEEFAMSDHGNPSVPTDSGGESGWSERVYAGQLEVEKERPRNASTADPDLIRPYAEEVVEPMLPRSAARIPHGTAGGYTNHKCRCDECRAVWSVYNRAAKQRRRARSRAGG
jgi:hypothetical protein